jgi:ubiquitin-protein ligase E3 C
MNQIDDLFQCDASLYRSLMDLKRRANNGEVIETFGLHFEYSRDEYGRVVNDNIKPNGGNIPVTNANLREYIILLANHKQNSLIRSQSRAFVKGFREMIPLSWIRMFRVHELQLVIGGDRRRIDVEDMRRNVVYHGYQEQEEYVQWFWNIVEEMTLDDQSSLLRFITSCPRQPLLGFAQLHPKIGIQRVMAHENPAIEESIRGSNRPNIAASGRLPTSATCMNLLKLPVYANQQTLMEKLLYAIRSKSGFELS